MESASAAGVDAEERTLRELLSDELYDFCTASSEAQLPFTSTGSALHHDKRELKEIIRLKDKTRNSNTTRTTNTWTNRFEAWRVARGLPHPLHEIKREELDGILQLFYSAIRRENGEDYEPVSLRTMIACLDRSLREHKKPFSILQDRVPGKPKGIKWQSH